MEKLLTYFAKARGRRGALAAALGISPSSISMWTRVPVDRVGDVEQITGISRHDLRPDIFGAAPDSSSETSQDASRVLPAGASADLADAPAFSIQENVV